MVDIKSYRFYKIHLLASSREASKSKSRETLSVLSIAHGLRSMEKFAQKTSVASNTTMKTVLILHR